MPRNVMAAYRLEFCGWLSSRPTVCNITGIDFAGSSV